MSTAAVDPSSIDPSSIYHEIQAYFHQRATDLSQLGSALQSGDLKGAQQAYNSVVALGETGPFANGVPFILVPRERDFAKIGQALQKGDLAGAQQAFSQLEHLLNTPAGRDPSGQVGPAAVVNLGQSSGTVAAAATSADSTNAGPEIVINIANNSSSADQITLDLKNPGNGTEQLQITASQSNRAPEQITLNFSQNSNEQIVVNLLNSVSSTSGAAQSSGVSLVA